MYFVNFLCTFLHCEIKTFIHTKVLNNKAKNINSSQLLLTQRNKAQLLLSSLGSPVLVGKTKQNKTQKTTTSVAFCFMSLSFISLFTLLLLL